MLQAASQSPPATPHFLGQAPRAADPDDLSEDLERRLDSSAGLKPAVWILVASALAARLAVILIMGDWGGSAAGEYGSLAASLVQGDGFALNETANYTQHGIYEPSSLKPPTYPLLLAGLYLAFGVKSAAAHISALLLAFWPTQVMAVAFVNPVTLTTLAVIGSVLLWNRSVETRGMGSWLAFTLVAALLALTEPLLLAALALVPLAILLQGSLPRPVRIRNAVLAVAMALVVIGPWTYRNWRVHHALVPVTSTFWLNMWMGNNPNATGTDRLVLTPDHLDRFRTLGQDRLRQTDLLSDAQRQHLDGRRAMVREAFWKGGVTWFVRDNPRL